MFQAFHYQSFHINKSQPLGHGSYGAVYKAKCDQLTCAAKVLHQLILDIEDPGSGKIMERFQQECAFLESIRHPHIVQFLGVTTDPDSRLPVLLMELLDENLTKMLEHSPQPLAYHVQVDICHDIALAVAYLHSNDIIHRDLSSNNVLIIAKRRAKVSDFGMSKLADAAPTTAPLTMCPGTLVYMPPEALREPPRYTKKLDCFSEGVIIIQVCTQRWPEPGPRTQVIRDSRSLTGIVEMPVPETERRKSHIDLIDPNNDLLPTSLDCLQFEGINRPSSEEICQRISALKVSTKYRESVQQQQDVIQAKDRQISLQTEQLQSMENVIQSKDDQLLGKDRELEHKQDELNELDIVLRQKEHWHQEERELQQRQLQWAHEQLKEQQQITAEMQHANISLLKQVERLKQQLDRERHQRSVRLSSLPLSRAQTSEQQFSERYSPKPSFQVYQNTGGFPHKAWEMTLSWKDAGKAPARMTRGAAVIDGSVAYFIDCSGVLCAYNSTSKKWRELPKYPYEYGSLAIIDGALTAIGGCRDVFEQSTYTNKLLSLHNNSWSDVFPPMPTKRHSTTTIATNTMEHVIVAGGSSSTFIVNIPTVEVMDTQSQTWSSVASLPRPYSAASATICGDHLYLLGGFDDRGKTKSVLTCSLTQLIGSLSSSSSVWHRVADVPVYRSTCVAVNGDLLAIGGCDERGKAKAAVHKYIGQSNSWDLIGNMPTARYNSLIVTQSLPNNEIMVLGGTTQRYNTRKIEIGFPY